MHQHRTATGFTPEVSIGGVRVSPGQQIHISPEHFERIKDLLRKLYDDGSIEVFEGKTAEGEPDVVLMRPEKAPVAETNPHGVYKPLEAKDLEKAQPPAPPPENPPVGDVLSQEISPPPPAPEPPPPPAQDVITPPVEPPPTPPSEEPAPPVPAKAEGGGGKKKKLM